MRLFPVIVLASDSDRLWGVPAEGGEPLEILPGTTVIDFDIRAASE